MSLLSPQTRDLLGEEILSEYLISRRTPTFDELESESGRLDVAGVRAIVTLHRCCYAALERTKPEPEVESPERLSAMFGRFTSFYVEDYGRRLNWPATGPLGPL